MRLRSPVGTDVLLGPGVEFEAAPAAKLARLPMTCNSMRRQPRPEVLLLLLLTPVLVAGLPWGAGTAIFAAAATSAEPALRTGPSAAHRGCSPWPQPWAFRWWRFVGRGLFPGSLAPERAGVAPLRFFAAPAVQLPYCVLLLYSPYRRISTDVHRAACWRWWPAKEVGIRSGAAQVNVNMHSTFDVLSVLSV